MDVGLNRIEDEAGLRALLAVAVADATPEETMPPLDGGEQDPPGWTERKQSFFLEFFRPMISSAETVVFAVTVGSEAGSEIAGFSRLKRVPEPGPRGAPTAETGMWLGRSYRGKGIGAAALDALLEEAARRGYTRVIADTTPGNVAAQGVLRHGRARMREGDGKIHAEMVIDRECAPE